MTGRVKVSSAFSPFSPAVGACIVLLAVTAAPTASAASPTVSPLAPTTPGLVHRWAALNQVSPAASVTSAQAAAVANNVDLVIVKSNQQTVVAAMKGANPRLTTLVYHNGAFAQKNEGTKYPASWYAHDAKGRKITQTVFGNYLMDVSNVGWMDTAVSECADARTQTGADGCYTDMMTTAPLFGGYVTSKPINPATKKPWTFPDYQAAIERIASRIHDEVPGPAAANGVQSGKRWYAAGGASSKTLTNVTDAVHSEIWLRDRSLAPDQWPALSAWQQDVSMVAEAEAENRVLMVETKLWDPASAELTDQWRRFTLASFLLATEGRSTWYLFTANRTFEGMTAADPWDSTPVGQPLGRYAQQASGLYSRSFENGFVAVNPTGNALAAALPSGTWQARAGEDGTADTGSVTLPPHTARIWTR